MRQRIKGHPILFSLVSIHHGGLGSKIWYQGWTWHWGGGQNTQGLVNKANNINVQSVVGYSNPFELSTDYFYINRVVLFP